MRNKFMKITFALVFAFFTLPFSGLTASAEVKVYDNIKDGNYEITAKAMHADEDKASGAAGFIDEEATLSIKDGLVSLTILIPDNDMAEISGLQIEEVEPVVSNGEAERYMTFDLASIKSELNARVQYAVPAFNINHDVPLRFNLEGLDELPVNAEEPTEPEEIPEVPEQPEQPETPKSIELADGSYTIDGSYLHSEEDKSSAMARYLNNSLFLEVVNGEVQITVTVDANETVTLLQFDGKNPVESKVDGEKRYDTFKLTNLESIHQGNVEYQAPMGDGNIHYGKADFRIVLDEDSVLKSDASLKPGTDIDEAPEDIPEEKPEQPDKKEVITGEKNPVNSNDEITIVNDNDTMLTLPGNLPGEVNLTISPEKPKNHKGLAKAGKVYDFSFTGLEGYEGNFKLEMSYDTDKYNSNQVDIYYYDEVKKEWIQQNGIVKDGKIAINPEHFSIYGVFAVETDEESSDETEVPEVPEVTGELVPDSAKQIDYTIIQGDNDKVSAADAFLEKPAILLEKDGNRYLQISTKPNSGKFIKSLRVKLGDKYQEMVIVEKTNDGRTIFQMKVNGGLSDVILLDMVIDVAGVYENQYHQARLFLDEASVQQVDATQYLLVASTNDNGPNAPKGEEAVNPDEEASAVPRPSDDNEDNANGTANVLDPKTPEKPGFGTGEGNEAATASGTGGNALNPQTGENTNLLLYVLLLIGSAIPLAVKAKRRFA